MTHPSLNRPLLTARPRFDIRVLIVAFEVSEEYDDSSPLRPPSSPRLRQQKVRQEDERPGPSSHYA
jgi:hypothetical protein